MALTTFQNMHLFKCFSCPCQCGAIRDEKELVCVCTYVRLCAATICQHSVYHSPRTCGGWGFLELLTSAGSSKRLSSEMQAESEQSCLYIYLQPGLGKVSDPAQLAHGESQVDLQVMHSAATASCLACGGQKKKKKNNRGGIRHIFERKPMLMDGRV